MRIAPLVVALFVTTSNAANAADSVCKEEPGTRRHDGFFFRTDTGLAFLSATVSGGVSPRDAVRGIGQSAGFSIGGTPVRGFVIGGTFWTARLEPTFIQAGKAIHPDDDSVKLTLLRIGPMVEWYPDDERGFHLGAAAGFTLSSESDVKGNPTRPTPLGAAISFGLGNEWFMSEQWSLGILGRAAFSALSRAPAGHEETMTSETLDLSITATYQ